MTTKTWPVLLAVLCGLALPLTLYAADYRFFWKASTDSSVTAYGIYQRSEGEGSAYVKIDEVKIQDLDNPNKPSYLITGLLNGRTYWFAATFIFISGDESELSSKTCITVNDEIEYCIDADDDGATVYISCFIRAAGEMFFSGFGGKIERFEHIASRPPPGFPPGDE
jgi:hypothetical protein